MRIGFDNGGMLVIQAESNAERWALIWWEEQHPARWEEGIVIQSEPLDDVEPDGVYDTSAREDG